MRQGLVIDTNILVSAIRRQVHKNARTNRLLQDIFHGKYDIYVSSVIIKEYKDVLYRPQVLAKMFYRWYWFRWIKKHAIYIEPKPSTQEQVEMRDETDRAFFDLAKCVNAKLVTRNYKHYPVHELVTLIEELYP